MARTVSSSAFFWEGVRSDLRSWLSGIVIGVFLVAFFLYSFFIAPRLALQDTENSPLHHGTGVVSVIRPSTAINSDGIMSTGDVDITLDNIPSVADTYIPTDSKLMQIGQRVQVTYRTGKSGRIYIINAKPIRETKP